MSLIDRLIGRTVEKQSVAEAPEVKYSKAATALVMTSMQVKWSPRTSKAFVEEGYAKNVVAFQCVEKITEAVASVVWTFWNGDKELETGPVMDLVKRPNPMESWDSFIKSAVAWLLMTGDLFIEIVDVGGSPREIYCLPSTRMKLKVGRRGFPTEYIYTVNGQEIPFPVDDKGKSNILHIRLFNPKDDWYGMSPFEPASFSVDQHNEAQKWIMRLLQNSATPSGALVVGGDNVLTDDQVARLKAEIEDNHSGAMNAGRPMLLEGGLDWKPMSLSPVDMQIVETKNSAARDICLAFGVPPQLLGIPGDNTYSNYQEARLAFWEDTVIPLLGYFASEFAVHMGKWTGEFEMKPDLSHIPAIADKQSKLWEMANASAELTVDEKRDIKGYEELPNGEGKVVLVNASQIPLGEASLSGDGAGMGDEFNPQEPPQDDPAAMAQEADLQETKRIVRLAYGQKAS